MVVGRFFFVCEKKMVVPKNGCSPKDVPNHKIIPQL